MQITPSISRSNASGIDLTCPVCGYGMEYPPADYNICPSCGTEFGVNDVNSSIAELRNGWIVRGLAWWSPVDLAPPGWNPSEQLLQLKAKEMELKAIRSLKPLRYAVATAFARASLDGRSANQKTVLRLGREAA